MIITKYEACSNIRNYLLSWLVVSMNAPKYFMAENKRETSPYLRHAIGPILMPSIDNGFLRPKEQGSYPSVTGKSTRINCERKEQRFQ